MLKRFFIFVYLIYLSSSVFLINAMELALREDNILNALFTPVITDYFEAIVKNQREIQEAFDNNPLFFNTYDVRLFFCKIPSPFYVNNKWNTVFKKIFTQRQSLLEIQDTSLNLITPYKYGPRITFVDSYLLIHNVLSMHPWSSITKHLLEKNINICISNQEERNARMAYLEERIQLYQKTFLKNQKDVPKSASFNLLLLTAFELLSYHHYPYLQYTCFFYQLFFNSQLDSAFKRAFFNYLIANYSKFYAIDSVIEIALESPHFKIDRGNVSCGEWYEKLHLMDFHLRNKILVKLGFSFEEIKNETQRILELK